MKVKLPPYLKHWDTKRVQSIFGNTAPKLLNDKLAEARLKISNCIQFYRPTAVVSLFSTGNDSQCLLHIAAPWITHIAHCNTGTGIEESRQHLSDVTANYRVPLIEEHTLPEDSYETLVMTIGFPGASKHNDAYRRLKERGLRRVNHRFVQAPRYDRVLFLAGIRADESNKRMKLDSWIDREGSTVWLSPIYYFTRDDLDTYFTQHKLTENPVTAKIHISGECLCGSYARPDELSEIEFWYPDVAERIRALELKVKAAGKRYCKWGGPPANGRIKDPGRLCSGCALINNTDVAVNS